MVDCGEGSYRQIKKTGIQPEQVHIGVQWTLALF